MTQKTCSICGAAVGTRNRTGMCKTCNDRKWWASRTSEQRDAHNTSRRVGNITEEERVAKNTKQNERNAMMTPEEREAKNAKQRIESMAGEQIERKNGRQRKYNADMPDKQKKAMYAKVAEYTRAHPQERRSYVLAPTDPDCTTLNKWFDGCEGHHMEWNVVIFIPKEINRSIYHNIKTGKNMDIINALAMEWLTSGGTNGVQTTLGRFV